MDQRVEISGRRALFTFCGVPLSLTCSGDKGWRLQSGRDGAFDDMGAGQILARDLKEEPPIVREEITGEAEGEAFCLRETSGTSVTVFSRRIDFCDEDGMPKASLTAVTDDGEDASVTGILHEDERIFGMGERFDALDQRGRRVDVTADDRQGQTVGGSFVPIPFFITSRCVGVFMNRYEHSVFDFGTSEPDRFTITQYGAPIDLYIFLGDKPQKLLFAYARVTGFAPEPAPWLYGTQIRRPSSEFCTVPSVMETARRMEENGLPWEAVILEGWPTYDTARFAELAAMTETLHDVGKKVMLHHPCGRIPPDAETLFAMDPRFALENGESGARSLPDADLRAPGGPEGEGSAYVDVTDPDAMDWWCGTVWGTLVEMVGIDGAKIDLCGRFPEHIPVGFADGRPTPGAHHWYPTLYSALMYQHFCSRPEGGMCLSCGGGIGAQRYPFLWMGDSPRGDLSLRALLRGALSAGLSGIPLVCLDVADAETDGFLRGLECAAFSAAMLIRAGETPAGRAGDVFRAYVKLHDALRPYLEEQGRVAAHTALPLMRALWLVDPTDERLLGIEDEYMLGGALLVAPVLDTAVKRDVYLPAGVWEDIWTGERIEGPTLRADADVPPELIPVYRLIGAYSQAIDGALSAARPHLDEILRVSEG